MSRDSKTPEQARLLSEFVKLAREVEFFQHSRHPNAKCIAIRTFQLPCLDDGGEHTVAGHIATVVAKQRRA